MRIGNLVNLYLSSTADFNSCGGWWTVWYEEIISKLFSLSLLIMAVCFINIERNIVAFIILIWMTRVPSCRCSCLFSWFSLFWKVSLIILMQQWSHQFVGRKEEGGGPLYDFCYFPLWVRSMIYVVHWSTLVHISHCIGGIKTANKM